MHPPTRVGWWVGGCLCGLFCCPWVLRVLHGHALFYCTGTLFYDTRPGVALTLFRVRAHQTVVAQATARKTCRCCASPPPPPLPPHAPMPQAQRAIDRGDNVQVLETCRFLKVAGSRKLRNTCGTVESTRRDWNRRHAMPCRRLRIANFGGFRWRADASLR